MISILLYHFILLFQLNIVSRNKTVSVKELVHVFAVGATAAVLGNLMIQGLAVKILGVDLVYYTVGPMVEELLKVSFVAFLLFFTRLGKRMGVLDAILLAAAAGAGYGFAEDAVRAVGLGLREMVEIFPAYNLASLPKLLITWLPSERTGIGQPTYEYVGRFVAGHLMWSALIGFGLGFARKWGNKNLLAYLMPLGLTAWVIADHSLANNPRSVLSFMYPWYGRGIGIYYAVSFAILTALVLDELLIKKHLQNITKFLLPGEKRRSLFGEIKQALIHLTFGFKHWLSLNDYFRLRRQLAFASGENDEALDVKEILSARREQVITSANFISRPVLIPANLTEVWQGPPLKFSRLNASQKILSFVVLGLVITQLYNVWLLLFSVYLPRRLSSTIANSPLTIVVGFAGYLIVIYQVIAFYKGRQWQRRDRENRVANLADALLTHVAFLNVLWTLPLFFGRHPLLPNNFLWSQFLMFLEFYRNNLRPWLGGTLSAAINFIPVVGNIKSGIEAWTGYDYIAGKEVKGLDRALAVLGAIPVAGNFLRALRYLPKSARLIQGLRYRAAAHRALRPFLVFDETVGKFKGKIDFFQATKDDYAHAFNELANQYEPLEQMKAGRLARERQSAIERWVADGWVQQVDSGHYQKSFDYQKVDIYTEKALKEFPDSVRSGVGQVTVDSASRVVEYDAVSQNYTPQKAEHLVKALGELQGKYPGSTIIYNQMFESGASVLHVQPPTGSSFQSVRLPVQSVSSR